MTITVTVQSNHIANTINDGIALIVRNLRICVQIFTLLLIARL
ncbi:MAG: hypothetical protein JWQ54_2757 [Mucilaginibacter sp.]|nr:hypothetical protein [Mucilaginibacter sp.]